MPIAESQKMQRVQIRLVSILTLWAVIAIVVAPSVTLARTTTVSEKSGYCASGKQVTDIKSCKERGGVD
jgi:hypothetical protein